MPKKNSFPFVQVVWRDRVKKDVRGYRGWAMFAGKRKFGPMRATPVEAHKDAMTMRGMLEAPSFGGAFETRANAWLVEVAATRAPDTVEFYKSKLASIYRTIPKTIAIDRISAPIVREFMREGVEKHRLGARTLQHCRRTLNCLFEWCRKRGYVQVNPIGDVDWPKPENRQPHVLNEVELADLLGRITDQWAADIAMFMALTGMRRAETARLQVESIDLASNVLWIRGKARSQSHPIPVEAAAVTKRLVAGAVDFIVPGKTHRARVVRLAETFRFWQKKLAEPRWHPHTLRHSVATIMLRQGGGTATVQRFLRHSSLAMMQVYAHMVEADVRGATSKLRLLGKDDKAAENA